MIKVWCLQYKVSDGAKMILGRRPAEPNRGVFVCTMDVQSFLSADGSQVR